MKIVVFGLTVSSSWGNGHATLWRGLGRALGRAGHRLVFFERDVSFYADHRDFRPPPGLDLVLYPDWPQVEPRARAELAGADVGIVTSFCPDSGPACEALFASRARPCFYDLDTPVTLDALDRGQPVAYLPEGGLGSFDLVLSFTGGRALDRLATQLHARRVVPLYGSADPETHRPGVPRADLAGDLSYLGTYSPDRQQALERLLLVPARRRPGRRFVIAGAQYPGDFPFQPNVRFVSHLPPPAHPDFFASSPLTLNVTRAPMAALGFCPSPRFFEAAACAVPVLSDRWVGLETFFEPEREVLLADDADQALQALELPPSELQRIGRRARERILAEHTAAHRAAELERALGTSTQN
jgi:spore maturation protein CgeB